MRNKEGKVMVRRARPFSQNVWGFCQQKRLERCFRLSLLVITALCVALSSLAHAAQVNASITGVVADQNKSLVPNASVVIESAQLAVIRSAHTNEDGYFIVTNLPVGIYRVTVEAEGF